nr:MAG TPA: hypothetical protein [Caudoviricetes sp.]
MTLPKPLVFVKSSGYNMLTAFAKKRTEKGAAI